MVGRAPPGVSFLLSPLIFREPFSSPGLLTIMKPLIQVTSLRAGFVLSALVFVGARTHGSVFWDESLQGDLSNNQAAPSAFTLQAGVNTLKGNAGSLTGDNQDWLRLNVPAGFELSAVTLTSFSSSDPTAF